MIDADRLLEGVARTLEESVLPALGSGFARGQLYAVLEVIGSLQGQLVWGGMLLDSEASSLAELIGQAAGSIDGELGRDLRDYAARTFAPLEDRLHEGRRLVCALIEAGHADAGPLAEALDAHLRNDAILKAMALRPTRLAEISQG